MGKELVRDYYKSFGENEWHRLTSPEGAIEFAVTTHFLNKYLPEHGRILDIGGGPGRYTIWLAQRGYKVVLADLSPNLLHIAQAKIAEAGVQSEVEDILVCDACNLSRFDDNSFDAVLCLGPFYHLTELTDREQAVSELVRVVKPKCTAFVALVSIYTLLRRTLTHKDEQHHLARSDFVSRLINEGVFFNDVPNNFNAGYAVRPQEVAPFFEKHGLMTVEILADTGFAAPYAQHLAELVESNPKAYEMAMKIIISTAHDPSIWGASNHLLYVGQKGM
ncbi:class I SAM-dependent methyltransferase [Chloroflexota bacterium]